MLIHSSQTFAESFRFLIKIDESDINLTAISLEYLLAIGIESMKFELDSIVFLKIMGRWMFEWLGRGG